MHTNTLLPLLQPSIQTPRRIARMVEYQCLPLYFARRLLEEWASSPALKFPFLRLP